MKLNVTVDTTRRSATDREVRLLFTSNFFRFAVPMKASFATYLASLISEAALDIQHPDAFGRVYYSEECKVFTNDD